MEERRTDSRLLCAELVEVIWADQRGRQQRRIANLEDISTYGACFQVENPMPCGTSISLRYGDGQLKGTVRYCLYQGLGYFLGVEFDEGCRWSRKQFRPRHLLDLKQLVKPVKPAVRRSRSNAQVSKGSLRIQ
jgi:ribulose bisphosphate carboxylase small subunit